MRDAEGVHDKGPENDRTPRCEAPAFDTTPRSLKQRVIVRIERRTKRSGKGASLCGMIPVVVANEKPERGPRDNELRAKLSHPLAGAGRSNASIDEESLSVRFDNETIAARAAAQDKDPHVRAIVAERSAIVEGKPARIGISWPRSFYDAAAMSLSPCPQCGHPAPEGARFCAQCGAVIGPSTAAPTPPPAPGAPVKPVAPLSKMTMMGFGPAVPSVSPSPQIAAPPIATTPAATVAATPAPPAAAPPARGPAGLAAPFRGTMMGLSGGGPVVPPAAGPVAQPGPKPRKPQATVLGVALPGIAPLRAGDSEAPLPDLPPAGGASAYPIGDANALLVPPLVPPPAPLAELPAPPPARVVRRKGVPIVAVTLVAGGLLLGGGLGLFWLSRDRPAITAQLHPAPDGSDVLGLHCDPASCKNGTTIEVEGARSTFVDGATDLTLSAPLHIGDNPLALHVDRPGLGRDEVVRLVVPVSFRIRADLSGLTDVKPTVSIRVEAAPDSAVTLDGKTLALDASGVATYAIDESVATEGPADESRVIGVQVPYSIVNKGGPPQSGSVAARFSVAPLRIDVPGTHGVVDHDRILVAGRAARGATVTLDGAPVSTAQDGSFEANVALSSVGERRLLVRAGSALLVPRTVEVDVKRVASLAQEARAFERLKPLSYDVAMANPSASVGQPVVVEGEVMKARSSGHRSILIVDDRRGCAKGSCLARVQLAQDVSPVPGTIVRAYGRVAPPVVAPSGETVLEVEADFAINKR